MQIDWQTIPVLLSVKLLYVRLGPSLSLSHCKFGLPWQCISLDFKVIAKFQKSSQFEISSYRKVV